MTTSSAGTRRAALPSTTTRASSPTGRIVMPDLVASLELIAADGPRALHHGELAELISRDVIERGGLLSPRRPGGVRARRPAGAR